MAGPFNLFDKPDRFSGNAKDADYFPDQVLAAMISAVVKKVTVDLLFAFFISIDQMAAA